MPRFGGLTPFPNRFGGKGSQGVRLEEILRSLNAQRGNAYDVSSTSNVYAENMATARVLNDIWSTNQRLSNQADPFRMTTTLPRWERILGIFPSPSDSDTTRRARVQAIRSRNGQAPFTSFLMTQIASAIGAVFVSVEFISYANASINVPFVASGPAYPFGSVATGAPWSSTTAHILIRLRQTSGYSSRDFFAAVGLLAPLMDSILPAWVTYDWYRAPSVGAPINVVGGPSAGGFYFDEINFDTLVFDA